MVIFHSYVKLPEGTPKFQCFMIIWSYLVIFRQFFNGHLRVVPCISHFRTHRNIPLVTEMVNQQFDVDKPSFFLLLIPGIFHIYVNLPRVKSLSQIMGAHSTTIMIASFPCSDIEHTIIILLLLCKSHNYPIVHIEHPIIMIINDYPKLLLFNSH